MTEQLTEYKGLAERAAEVYQKQRAELEAARQADKAECAELIQRRAEALFGESPVVEMLNSYQGLATFADGTKLLGTRLNRRTYFELVAPCETCGKRTPLWEVDSLHRLGEVQALLPGEYYDDGWCVCQDCRVETEARAQGELEDLAPQERELAAKIYKLLYRIVREVAE